ncbi:MAG TPA: hypothetical protein VLG49_01560 [Rhabdochlamydiaceae bacterium]|nr:hypothetical protein [Rhabdochlamydiaceae bacterium]
MMARRTTRRSRTTVRRRSTTSTRRRMKMQEARPRKTGLQKMLTAAGWRRLMGMRRKRKK